jgi:protein PhnA
MITQRQYKLSTCMEVKDSNVNVLNDGDSVTLIKDLKVKGSSLALKRSTVAKKIRLTDSEDEVGLSHQRQQHCCVRNS